MAALEIGVVLFSILFILVNVYVWLVNRRIWAMGKKIPGPKVQNSVLGNVNLFLDPSKLLSTVMGLFETHGPVVRLWMGPALSVILKDPDDVQLILGDKDIRNRPEMLMKIANIIQGTGMATDNNEVWKTKRRALTHTFNVKVLKRYIEEFGINARATTDTLKAYADRGEVDLIQHLPYGVIESVCNTMMGNTDRTTFTRLVEFLKELINTNKYIRHLATHPWYVLVPKIYKMTTQGKKAKKFKQVAKVFASWLLSKKISEYETGAPSATVPGNGDKNKGSLIDAMLSYTENGRPVYSEENIEEEIVHMLAVATATTSLSLAYTLMLIAMYPEVQQDLHREMDDIFGSDTRHATFEDIERMDLLDRCIKESLRLLPVSSINPRDIPKDVQLPSGYIIPAGCHVINFAFAIHRDPRYYPDPEEFIPDRWLPENRKNIHPYAYIPFSLGVRECIGKKFAQFQMKSILSQIIRELELHPVYDLKTIVNQTIVSMASTLSDATGYLLRLTLRQRAET